MKQFIKATATLIVVSMCLTFFVSCCKDPDSNFELFPLNEGGTSLTKTISGTATISKDPVQNGDVVFLSIGPLTFDINGIIVSSTSYSFTIINGKEIGIPMVHYYIDGTEVGQSNDMKHDFAFEYNVSGLEQGTHILSAKAQPQEEGTKFIGEYTESEFTVIVAE